MAKMSMGDAVGPDADTWDPTEGIVSDLTEGVAADPTEDSKPQWIEKFADLAD